MTKELWDRRHFLAAGTALSVAGTQTAEAKTVLSAADVIARIRDHVGCPLRSRTVDGLVYGSPDTPVIEIATTMMATFETLKRAVAAKKNFIVSHEPTFWTHQEDVSGLKDDPMYRAKCAFMKQHGIVSYHFHDQWHDKKPEDGIWVGMTQRLGWEGFSVGGRHGYYAVPEQSLSSLVGFLRTRLNDNSIRVIGDPNLRVRRIAASWGFFSGQDCNAVLNRDINVVMVGETREWESVEYAQDLVANGNKKALVILGHVASEQWGMKFCADWLKEFIPEVPVEFLPLPDPFWTAA